MFLALLALSCVRCLCKGLCILSSVLSLPYTFRCFFGDCNWRGVGVVFFLEALLLLMLRKKCCTSIRHKKKSTNPNFLSLDIVRWGGGIPREGVGAKKFGMPLETREIKLFWRDIPGFCRDIPDVPKKLEKKKFVFNSRPLFKALLLRISVSVSASKTLQELEFRGLRKTPPKNQIYKL